MSEGYGIPKYHIIGFGDSDKLKFLHSRLPNAGILDF